MKKQKRPLELTTETIRVLRDDETQLAAGGLTLTTKLPTWTCLRQCGSL